jgi:hypothetical protein
MAIILPGGFNITNNEPVDARISLADQSARYALSSANVYEGLQVYQKDNNTIWILTDTANVGNSAGWTQLVIGTLEGNLPNGVISSSQQVIDIILNNFTSFTQSIDNTFATDQELYVTSSNLDAGEF